MNRKCIQFYNSPSPHVQRYLTRLSCIWLAQVLTQPKMGISTAICSITLMWVLGDLPQLWEAFNLWHIWASCKTVANVLCAEINGQILSKLRANKTKQQNSFKTKQQTLTRQILILKCSTGENKKKTWMSLKFSNFFIFKHTQDFRTYVAVSNCKIRAWSSFSQNTEYGWIINLRLGKWEVVLGEENPTGKSCLPGPVKIQIHISNQQIHISKRQIQKYT